MSFRNRNRRMGLVLLLCAGGLALLLLALSGSAMGSITGDTPPATGDWVINNPTKVSGETVTIVEGDIVVKNTLTIDTSSTIIMDVSKDGEHMVNVTSTGHLIVKWSTFTSSDPEFEYAFEINGEADITNSTIEEVHNGIAVFTDDTVNILNTNIMEITGRSFFLQEADGTTIRNVIVRSDDFNINVSMEFNPTIDYQYYYNYIYLEMLHILGGKPTIDNLDISVNGSYNLITTTNSANYYTGHYNYLYVTGVIIDGAEASVSDVNIHDYSIGISSIHYMNSSYAGSNYFFYYNYLYPRGVIIKNWKNLALGSITVDEPSSTSPTMSVVNIGGSTSYYTYAYIYGYEKLSAVVDKVYGDAGPHDIKLTIRDTSYENTSALSVYIQPGYSGANTPTFNVDVIIDNITATGTVGTQLFYIYVYPQFADMKIFNLNIRLSNSTFTGIKGQVLYSYLYRGTGAQGGLTFEITETWVVENNLFKDCALASSSYLFYDYAYNYGEINNRRDRTMAYRNNTFDHISAYMLMYMYGGYDVSRGLEWLIIEDNKFIHFEIASGSTYAYYMFYAMGYERMIIRNNLFDDCHPYYYNYLTDYGGYSSGQKAAKWWVLNNTFLRCSTVYTGSSYGFMRFYGAWETEVAYNNITECSGILFNVYEYTYYASGGASVDFHDNEIWNNSASVVYLGYYANYHTELTVDVHHNRAQNSNGALVDFYDYPYYQDAYDYDAKIMFNDNTIINFTDVVFRNYGDMEITGNIIKDSVGYLMDLRYLNLHLPKISNNVISNCVNVYAIAAKQKGALKITMSISDLYVDCTGNAFRFSSVGVTLTNVTISNNVGIAIIVEDAEVDAVDCLIPVGSGKVIGDGSINVWHNLEADVFWSDAQGNPSGVGVSEALVIFQGSTGAYFASAYTDENGHMRPKRVLNWQLNGPFVTLWSPYTISYSKTGMANSSTLVLDRSYLGEDAIQLTLNDNSVPYVKMVSPFPDTLTNQENLTVLGFATELGSGIKTLTVSLGGGEPVDVELNQEDDFTHTFHSVPDGDLTLTALVRDVAGNEHSETITVKVDRTPPRLVILDPDDEFVTNQRTVLIRAEIEEGASVVINDIKSGESTGIVTMDFPVSEGINTILIQATDVAGNMAFMLRTVYRDTVAPSLSIFGPRDQSITAMNHVLVDGEVEVGSHLFVSVLRSTGTDLVDEKITPDENGLFSHQVDLGEGRNEIIVTASDDAGNQMELRRVVFVDTTVPLCRIDSPANGYLTNKDSVTVTGKADVEGVIVYLNGKQIHNDGTISRVVRLNEGENTITLTAVDLIGNEASDTITVYLDSVAPDIRMISPLETEIMIGMYSDMYLYLEGEVIGDANRLTINIGTVELYPDGDFAAEVPLDFEGISEIVLGVFDLAGNAGWYTITVDRSTAPPPLVVEYSPADRMVRTPDGNLYITGTTTGLVKEVKVILETASGTSSSTYTVREAIFDLVLTLEKGENSVKVMVTDVYGNTNTTATHQVTYDPPKVTEGGEEGVTIEPQNIGIALLVIAITLFITAVIVTRSFRQRAEDR